MLEKIKEPAIHLSLDDFHDKLCKTYSDNEWKLYYEEVKALHRTARVWHEQSFNVVVDCVLAEARLWDDLEEALPNAYMVGLFAPLDVLLEREKARGRGHYGRVQHQFGITHQRMGKSELRIDAEAHPADEIADFVLYSLRKKYA